MTREAFQRFTLCALATPPLERRLGWGVGFYLAKFREFIFTRAENLRKLRTPPCRDDYCIREGEQKIRARSVADGVEIFRSSINVESGNPKCGTNDRQRCIRDRKPNEHFLWTFLIHRIVFELRALRVFLKPHRPVGGARVAERPHWLEASSALSSKTMQPTKKVEGTSLLGFQARARPDTSHIRNFGSVFFDSAESRYCHPCIEANNSHGRTESCNRHTWISSEYKDPFVLWWSSRWFTSLPDQWLAHSIDIVRTQWCSRSKLPIDLFDKYKNRSKIAEKKYGAYAWNRDVGEQFAMPSALKSALLLAPVLPMLRFSRWCCRWRPTNSEKEKPDGSLPEEERHEPSRLEIARRWIGTDQQPGSNLLLFCIIIVVLGEWLTNEEVGQRSILIANARRHYPLRPIISTFKWPLGRLGNSWKKLKGLLIT